MQLRSIPNTFKRLVGEWLSSRPCCLFTYPCVIVGRVLWLLQIPELPWEAVESLHHPSSSSHSPRILRRHSGDPHLRSSKAESPAIPRTQEVGFAFTSSCCLWHTPGALPTAKRESDVFFWLLSRSLPSLGCDAFANHLEIHSLFIPTAATRGQS